MFSNVMTADAEKRVQNFIGKHLKVLVEKITIRFPQCNLQPMDWIRNSFSNNIPLG